MYNVMIVEDDPMARRLLEIMVTSDESYHLAVSVESASVAEVYCMTEAIDLILMDVCTALHASGLDAAIKIKKLFPQIRIIIITGLPECSFIERAREGGVDSFWYKDPFENKLLDIMNRTMMGESIYPDQSPTSNMGLATSSEFTERELDVLRELISGDTDEMIAERLNLSVHTIKKALHEFLWDSYLKLSHIFNWNAPSDPRCEDFFAGIVLAAIERASLG